LRAAQQQLLDTLLPRLAIRLPPQQPLDLAALFDGPRAGYWLEIGFGGGEHLAWQAAQQPALGLIGCEPFVNGVVAALGHIEAAGLTNVRLWPEPVLPLLEALPAAAFARVFVLFPDPWPKLRHHKRRLIQRPVLDLLARLLVDRGELRIATDDPDYRRWILAEALDHGGFEWTARRPADWRERPPDWPPTRYERKARTAGRDPVFFRFRRRMRPPAGGS
jgi:tRNA (guanine-N7-)-methyltransferase